MAFDQSLLRRMASELGLKFDSGPNPGRLPDWLSCRVSTSKPGKKIPGDIIEDWLHEHGATNWNVSSVDGMPGPSPDFYVNVYTKSSWFPMKILRSVTFKNARGMEYGASQVVNESGNPQWYPTFGGFPDLSNPRTFISRDEALEYARKQEGSEEEAEPPLPPDDSSPTPSNMGSGGSPMKRHVSKAKKKSVEEDTEDGAPFSPSHSAMKIAHAYNHHKNLHSYLTDEDDKVDHPGVHRDLQKHAKDLESHMEYLKGCLHKHHGGDTDDDPHDFMEKHCKSLGQNAGDSGDLETGEANQVDLGEIPEEKPGGVGEPGEMKDEGSKEEILERYQHPKSGKWFVRKMGVVHYAPNGRVYLQRYKNAPPWEEEDKCGTVLGPSKSSLLNPGDTDPHNPQKNLLKPGDTTPQAIDPLQSRKNLLKPGDNSPTDMEFLKGLPDEEEMGDMHEAMEKAEGFMDEIADNEEVPKSLRANARYHSKRLYATKGNFSSIRKSLSNAGKLQRTGGSGSTLTDEGTMGNKGSMKDQGARQGKNPGAAVGTAGTHKTTTNGQRKVSEAVNKAWQDLQKTARWVGIDLEN